MEIKVTKNPNPAPPLDETKLGFGVKFTDHMFIMDYTEGKGWHDARIVPYGDITISPAATVFHYGLEIFEGMKAYRTPDGTVQLFRPTENIKRMNNSALRLTLPTLDEDDALQAITEFVRTDSRFVPSAEGTSLYIRPFMFGCEPNLGLHKVKDVKFMIIASPSGTYYDEGIDPVSIMIETEDVRAVRGGTGYTKCGGNYAAANRAGEKAEKLGYTQVLWLDGVERKYIEEVGSMNVMFKLNGKIVTPDLIGTVLPGVTRKSIIELLASEGYEVEERRISVDEVMQALENGTLEEAWGCGTAAIVSPIGKLVYKGKEYVINNGKTGSLTSHIYDELTGIQWGKKPDRFGWTLKI